MTHMTFMHSLLLASTILAAALAAGHALLHKRDPRSAWGWTATCLLFPLMGPLLYIMFGVNRVRTRGIMLREHFPFKLYDENAKKPGFSAAAPESFARHAHISSAITGRKLVGGNQFEPLHNGDEAYPPMLQAINEAQKYIYLSTYIFDDDRVGNQFIDALEQAKDRGVLVRVLVDGYGELSSLALARRKLKRRGVDCAGFLPLSLVPPRLSINLRCHHKILVVDGKVGFTGGLNISDRYITANTDNLNRVQDVHFRIHGPLVAQMEEIFLWTWGFASHEKVLPPQPRRIAHQGTVLARTAVDGPDEPMAKISVLMATAISQARRRVSIMTPYFLPPRELIGEMNTAALRGVDVSVILPAKTDNRIVHYATQNMLWELLQYGVRVFYQPPPFAHTKLFFVDHDYSLVGSSNLDPRSLRLNFEFCVEVYDKRFTTALVDRFDEVKSRSREVFLHDVDSRPLPAHLRDAFCWLFTPYL